MKKVIVIDADKLTDAMTDNGPVWGELLFAIWYYAEHGEIDSAVLGDDVVQAFRIMQGGIETWERV